MVHAEADTAAAIRAAYATPAHRAYAHTVVIAYALVRDAYRRAYDRAVRARLVAYRVDDRTFEVPSISHPDVLHRVRRVGPAWYEWACDCMAAPRCACVHRAVAVYAHKYHTGAARARSPRKEVEASAA